MSDISYILELNRYQRDNLLALLHVIYILHGVPLDTGDWIGEIYHMLAPYGYEGEDHHPNMVPKDQIKYLEEWAKYKK